ncbi:MAG: tetratricopeptide repeat protein [Bdellovibrionales bacterium]|nr:tetratricopeptide repeat protein [Bdellovibrionales bacterium]
MDFNTASARSVFRLTWISVAAFLCSCTVQSSISNRYLTAEKLWTEKNYAAAVTEFDRIVKENPNSTIGLQALWRASMTRTLFLNQQEVALQGFETFLERASSSELAPEAQKEIGDIYFNKLNQYSKAIDVYQRMVDSKKFSPDDEATFLFRIARAHFLAGRLKKAIEIEESFPVKYPKSPLNKKVSLELANSWYALGDADKLAYPKALKLYEDLSKVTQGKDSALFLDARFGQAATLEELDRLEDAYEIFRSIESTYPAPNVVKIRMLRLEERMNKKRK